MTIHLPRNIEDSIEQAVQNGRFASMDDAMTRAAALLLEELDREARPATASESRAGLGSIGAMRDAAEELDEVVGHAMNLRQRSWRLPPGE